jgi:putative transposase
MSESLRPRLLAQVGKLPAVHLPALQQWLASLECGDLSPLSIRQSGDKSPHSKESKDWPRAPIHRLSEFGTYIVTSGTLHKEHYFQGTRQLDLLESALLRHANAGGWQIEAWAVFSNHYHFVAHAMEDATPLRAVLTALHAETAREINCADRALGRQVWHNFWDTELTFEKSYLARLNYVHHNAVKHGLARVANQYRWCSAAWFERTASRAQIQTIYGFKIDKVRVLDEYQPV